MTALSVAAPGSRSKILRPKKILRVGVDLDGVNYCFDQAVARRWCSERSIDPSTLPEATHWNFYLDYPMSLQEFLDLCDRAVDAGEMFLIGEPYEGAVDACWRLANAGHELHVVTDRTFGSPGKSEQNTRQWWKDSGYPEFTSITFSADKTAVPTDVFIDDKLENYDALDAAGVNVWLLTRPWNLREDNRRRVASMAQFADWILSGKIPAAQAPTDAS